MELIQPGLGLIFWMIISFGAVLFILGKYAWPAITKGLKEREESISDALALADKAREEMAKLKADNEELIRQAKDERDAILSEARKVKKKIIEESKDRANIEASRIIESAKERIENEKKAAMIDLKNEIGNLSIDIAEKVLKAELSQKGKHEELIRKLVDEVGKN